MANPPQQQTSTLSAGPLLLVVLVVAHVFALGYLIYRLGTQKQPQRRKEH